MELKILNVQSLFKLDAVELPLDSTRLARLVHIASIEVLPVWKCRRSPQGYVASDPARVQSRVVRVYLPCCMKISFTPSGVDTLFTILGRSAVAYPRILRAIYECLVPRGSLEQDLIRILMLMIYISCVKN